MKKSLPTPPQIRWNLHPGWSVISGPYLEAAVLEGGDPLACAPGCQQGLGGLVGPHRHQLDGPVITAGRQVGVAVVEDEGAHPALELEALADLLPAEVVHVDGVVVADEQVLLGGVGELDD